MARSVRDFALTIGLAIIAALSIYYTTIESLKLELRGKAEETFVANLDKRISGLEVKLADNFATKRDFYQLKEDLLVRLTRIEIQLDGQIKRSCRQKPSDTGISSFVQPLSKKQFSQLNHQGEAH
jgi:hypothetical protein